ncbi:MAG: hypothetical protein QNJ43_20165 [Breoghania sp.]|nr:hypothetical protein [Breoghania sp.]
MVERIGEGRAVGRFSVGGNEAAPAGSVRLAGIVVGGDLKRIVLVEMLALKLLLSGPPWWGERR